jgi:isoleucyl-tRNA synthetase
VPLICGLHVTVESGTGLVHTAPAHGLEDYQVGLHYQLPVNNPVGADGKFLPNTPQFAGELVWDANKSVLETWKPTAPCCARNACNTATRTAGATRHR